MPRFRALGCASWRVWAAPDRPDPAWTAASGRSSASHAQAVTDATSIGNDLIPRPRAASSRPEEDVPVASII